MGRAPVIGRDQAEAQALASAYRSALPTGADPLLHAFDATITDPIFPGALLAWPRQPSETPVFYAAAQTQAQWRRLRPLLLAFVGPTMSDFSGAASRLDPTLPHEQVLAAAGFAAVVRLVPATQTASSMLRALHRLTAMVAKTRRRLRVVCWPGFEITLTPWRLMTRAACLSVAAVNIVLTR